MVARGQVPAIKLSDRNANVRKFVAFGSPVCTKRRRPGPVSDVAMNLGNVSWDAVAAAGGGAGGLLAIWPLVRSATKRATMRRRLIQSVAVLREIRASGIERPSTIALSRALEEV